MQRASLALVTGAIRARPPCQLFYFPTLTYSYVRKLHSASRIYGPQTMPRRNMARKLEDPNREPVLVKPLPTDLPVHPFPTPLDFANFLSLSHADSPGIYLKIARKSSHIPSITWCQAVEVALCYGWIDGLTLGYDSVWHLRRFTPRRPKSVWSARNVELAERLIAEGKMETAGLKAIEAAKMDGRWDKAYGGMKDMVVPEDLLMALDREESARVVFEALRKGDKYTLVLKVEMATGDARVKRIDAVIKEMLGRGEHRPADRTKRSKTKEDLPLTNTVGALTPRRLSTRILRSRKPPS